ncbi:MAG: radical SAM protein [bacterium]
MANRIEINLGYPCNNNCLFCGEGENRRLYLKELMGCLTLEKVKEEILSFRQSGYDHITFLGGEPTIRKDFIEIVLYARTMGFKTIFLTTNGRMLSNKSFARDAVEAGLTEICLSLHGPTAEIHDLLTASKRSYDQVRAAMDNLAELGRRFSTSTVITRPGAPHLPELARLLLSYHPLRMIFSYPNVVGNALDNFDTIVPIYTETMRFAVESIELARQDEVMMTIGQAPFCVMEGYESYADILYWGGQLKRVVRKFKAREVEDGRVVDVHGKGKVKKPFCRQCRYWYICEGMEYQYEKRVGAGELTAIPGDQITDPEILKSQTYFYKQIEPDREKVIVKI